MKRVLFLIIFLCGITAMAQAAKPDTSSTKLIQLSGVVVTGDSLRPVPFVNIIIKNTYRGVVSDYYGFFSIVAKEKDTLEFSAVGFRKTWFIIPDTLTEQRYSLIQILRNDTITLPEALIYPWPTKQAFEDAFVNFHPPDGDLERAQKNLNRTNLSLIAEHMTMDGSMNYREQMNYRSNKFYSAGQLPPYTILDPIAWAKFIDMWKSGAFKKKDKRLKDDN